MSTVPEYREEESSGSDENTEKSNSSSGARPLKRARHSSHSTPSPKPSNANSIQVNGRNGYMPAAVPNLPPLSLSILGVEPLDEFILEVADFVHHIISTRPQHLGGQVELEARIGVLRDKASGQRPQLPVLVETILNPEWSEVRFESNMSVTQHRHYNSLLNNLMTSSFQPGHPSTPLKYNHQYLIDSFYPSDNPRDRERIRVTRDQKSGAVVECLKKIRLADLNVYSPKRGADWRISVSLEIPVAQPTGTPTHTRRKDRLNYTHEEFVIGLTQVTSAASQAGPPEVLHELELEVVRPELLLATASKRNDSNVPEQERYAFDELIRAFVNNARILVRNSGEGWQ